MELEKRYRELTDLLVSKLRLIHVCSIWFPLYTCSNLISYISCLQVQYYKQTQLEAMASEKAAAEFQLEKEAKRLQEVQVCALVYKYFGIGLHSTPCIYSCGLIKLFKLLKSFSYNSWKLKETELLVEHHPRGRKTLTSKHLSMLLLRIYFMLLGDTY